MGPKGLLLFFFQLAHFSYNMKHAISIRWLANPNPNPTQDATTFLTIFEANMNVFVFVKVKILVFIKWLYRSPLMLAIEFENCYHI